MDMPFTPFPFSSQRIPLADVAQSFIPPTTAYGVPLIVWIDNRGSTDVLVEVGSASPSDTTSFAIGAGVAQPLYLGDSRIVGAKRPAGSVAEQVIVSFGMGM